MTIQTGILMLNLGGPQTLDQVEPFLLNLFADREIIQLPFQSWLGPFIARRRTPKVQANYRAIGGGSPILHWTQVQGQGMVERLDRLSPHTAPHRFYPAFRYIEPDSRQALLAMKADGVQRAVAFTQYPQFSCTTTGSSLNELWRVLHQEGLERAFEWSLIDRWFDHPGFIDAMAHSVEVGLEAYPAAERAGVLLLFSAHSLPLHVINRGDPYPHEIAASMHAVLRRLSLPNPYLLTYQSEVGPVKWLGPSTEKTLRQLGRQGQKNVLVVPVAFTSDHIETLSEIDLEYGELAREYGIRGFHRAPALNDDPVFLDALADIVHRRLRRHLDSGEVCSPQYRLRCPGCTNPACRELPQG
jgi:protoporphyrin/coproporphyrin ferrochelatase